MNPVLPHLQQFKATFLESRAVGTSDIATSAMYDHISSSATENRATFPSAPAKTNETSKRHQKESMSMRGHRHEERAVQRSMLSVLLNQQQEETTHELQQHEISNAARQGEQGALPGPGPSVDVFGGHQPQSPPPEISVPQVVRSAVAVDFMQQRRRTLESEMTERLQQVKLMDTSASIHDDSQSSTGGGAGGYSSRGGQSSNEARKSRRARHHQAITHDLTEIATDLFLAESKLVNPSLYGVQTNLVLKREQVFKCVQDFILSLPPRYALGAESPSEVLIHMRLMAAVRADPGRPSVHIANLDDDAHWMSTASSTASVSSSSASTPAIDSTLSSSRRKLVTICCSDQHGLLEYISRILATGGSRVLDADVMLSTDNIALDRFVVEMNGRLRLDKLAQYVGEFLERAKRESPATLENSGGESENAAAVAEYCLRAQKPDLPGPLYFRHNTIVPVRRCSSSMDMLRGVPLHQALKEQSGKSRNLLSSLNPNESFLPLSRSHTILPTTSTSGEVSSSKRGTKGGVTKDVAAGQTQIFEKLASKDEDGPSPPEHACPEPGSTTKSSRVRPLVKRQGIADLDAVSPVPVPKIGVSKSDDSSHAKGLEKRNVPLIPFDELMLIETLGVGRVSTIYRAAWRPKPAIEGSNSNDIRILALKVAMVNPETHDALHIQELHREFEIAACLQHPNISHLVGIAEDHDCFCLAYEYCEGGSLLSLVSDRRRCYEYLPIALDIVQGMAYLHSRNVIHRDLKLSNILLDRNNRAKISDFGMSVAMAGQELTAETGTYRYMAPEVIRHESYSSNADVYSFGICLWQLITREIPFATMTPIQAAFQVAQGERPPIPDSTPRPLKEIMIACWEQDSRKRPSFTWIAMALYDYATSAFSPATVSAQTLQIANDMIASVEGNSTVNVDFSAPLAKSAVAYKEKDQEETDDDVGLEL